MFDPIPGTPAYYRAQAAKVRKMAEAEPTLAIGRQLLRVARDYEKLADEEENKLPNAEDEPARDY